MGGPGIAGRQVIVVSNPVAGNGRGLRYAHRLVDALKEDGADISWEITRQNPGVRVQGIIDVLRRSDPERAPTVIVCAGDGTDADVCKAVRAVQTDEFRPLLVPGPGGTAGDLRRELGVPASPAGMLRFLSTAVPADLEVVTASVDGGPEIPVVHSLGFGVSGAFFTAVAQRREATGRASIPIYLRALASGVASAELFFVSIDGAPPLPVGEVFTGVNSTSMGAVTRIPLPAGGARVHAIPLNPNWWGVFQVAPGLPPLLDAFRRGALYMMGDRTVISPGEAISRLSADHMRDVAAGESVRLDFLDADGAPRQVLGVANGDPTGPASTAVIRHTGETISTLASRDSAYRIRRGLVRPTTLAQRMLPSGPASTFGGVSVEGEGTPHADAGEGGDAGEGASPFIALEAGAAAAVGAPFLAGAGPQLVVR